MTFGEAIVAAKEGKRIVRDGWNGKYMYVYYQEGSVIKAENCRNLVLKRQAEESDGFIEILPHLDMFTAQGSIVCGWLASQTDMLMDDWRVV